MYLVYSFEIIFFWIMMIYLAIKSNRRPINDVPAFQWAFLLFAIINLFIIGYSIPNIGSITRYRSIFLPFIGLFIWSWFNGDRFVEKRLSGLKTRFSK
jgi:hypothetical protein